jgi:hypothetical protein
MPQERMDARLQKQANFINQFGEGIIKAKVIHARGGRGGGCNWGVIGHLGTRALRLSGSWALGLWALGHLGSWAHGLLSS